jgi:hypothetical protein
LREYEKRRQAQYDVSSGNLQAVAQHVASPAVEIEVP